MKANLKKNEVQFYREKKCIQMNVNSFIGIISFRKFKNDTTISHII